VSSREASTSQAPTGAFFRLFSSRAGPEAVRVSVSRWGSREAAGPHSHHRNHDQRRARRPNPSPVAPDDSRLAQFASGKTLIAVVNRGKWQRHRSARNPSPSLDRIGGGTSKWVSDDPSPGHTMCVCAATAVRRVNHSDETEYPNPGVSPRLISCWPKPVRVGHSPKPIPLCREIARHATACPTVHNHLADVNNLMITLAKLFHPRRTVKKVVVLNNS
jgi:hypothetical protein